MFWSEVHQCLKHIHLHIFFNIYLHHLGGLLQILKDCVFVLYLNEYLQR